MTHKVRAIVSSDRTLLRFLRVARFPRIAAGPLRPARLDRLLERLLLEDPFLRLAIIGRKVLGKSFIAGVWFGLSAKSFSYHY